jgi:hypothetical protein
MAKWDQEPIVGSDRPKYQSDPIAAEPGLIEQAGRQVGLTARNAVQGALALPALGADAIGYLLNLGIKAHNSISDNKLPEFKPTAESLGNVMTTIGLPNEETPQERIVGSAVRGMSSAGGNAIAGAKAAPGAVKTWLTTRPDVQVQAGLGGGVASGLVREGGGGPLLQAGAGLLGGIALPASVSFAKGVPSLLKNFTQSGQNDTAGQVLHQAAASPADSLAALDNPSQLVPGSNRTLAQVTKDPGLASLERSMVSKPSGAEISQQYGQQNAARLQELDSLAGTEADISSLKAARNEATNSARESALNNGVVGAPSDVVIRNIDATLKSPVGKREVVASALDWAKTRLRGVTDPAELYSVRQDIGDAMNGKLAGDKAAFKLASGELAKIKSILDDVIESDAPGFKGYLQKFKDASKPINQLEVMQEIRRRSLGTLEDSMGNRQLLPSQFARSMDNADEIAASATGFKKAQTGDILTPEQAKRLEALRQDLTGEAFAKAGGKVSGSNTMQLANYSTANIIGRMVGGRGDAGPITRNLGRALDWLNKYNDQDIDRILVEAVKDPLLAKTLMMKASKDNVELASDAMKNIARAMGMQSITNQALQTKQTDKSTQQ